MKTKFIFILFFIISIGAKSQAVSSNNQIEVYDFDNKVKFEDFKMINSKLDEDHPNLLDPKNSETDNKEVISSWTKLHYSLGEYLTANDFKWKVNAPELKIVHKIYFEPNGKIKSYFFKVLSDEISEAQRKKYSQLVTEFAKDYRIDLNRNHQFAQCGKTKYINE